MSLFPESQLGIWLNTPTKFLERTSEANLRPAKNDACWSTAANDSAPILLTDRQAPHAPPPALSITPTSAQSTSSRSAPPSSDSLIRLSLVSTLLKNFYQELKSTECHPRPTLVDLGGHDALTQSTLKSDINDLEYIGTQKVSLSGLDVCASLTHPYFADRIRACRPDVLLCLDVLEHLAQNAHSLRGALQQLASVGSHASLIVFSLPGAAITSEQRNSSCHQAPVDLDQWLDLLNEFFDIEQTMAFNFLPSSSAPHRAPDAPGSDDSPRLETPRTGSLQLSLLESLDVKLSTIVGTGPLGRALVRAFGSSVLLVATAR